MKSSSDKSLESWIWDAACSIRGAKDAPKYKDYILPLIFTKRLCDVFDDELNRIAAEVGSRKKAFQLAKADHKLVRFYLPLVPDDPEQPVWSVIRKLSDKIGEGVTTHMRAIARENPLLQGIIDRVDFNATTHGQRVSETGSVLTIDTFGSKSRSHPRPNLSGSSIATPRAVRCSGLIWKPGGQELLGAGEANLETGMRIDFAAGFSLKCRACRVSPISLAR